MLSVQKNHSQKNDAKHTGQHLEHWAYLGTSMLTSRVTQLERSLVSGS